MGTKQSFSERTKAEIDMINLHLKLASMDAADELKIVKAKIANTIAEIKDFFSSLLEKEEVKETKEVEEKVIQVRSKAEVIESIMALRAERETMEEKQINTEAQEAVHELNAQVNDLFEQSELGKLKNEYEQKLENKLLEVSKFFIYQDKYDQAKADKQAQMKEYIESLEKRKEKLEAVEV